ncbi:hypothetical protein BDE02_04G164600 [Populus trichocarpa]|nr:hypothetical protein BDE02_04G164600 [Populus trichocarpa]
MESKPNGNAAAARVHEEFEPSIDWVRETGADTLRIYLPGFKKEQLKVQVTSSRVLRVSGERQLSGNRWSTFRKEIPISSNYDTNEIAARFEKGILYVKQPKIIVPDAPKPQEQARSPVEASKNDQKPAQENAQPPPIQAQVNLNKSRHQLREKWSHPQNQLPSLKNNHRKSPQVSNNLKILLQRLAWRNKWAARLKEQKMIIFHRGHQGRRKIQ